MDRNSVVGSATCYVPTFEPGEANNFSIFLQEDFRAHPAFCTMDTGALSRN